MEAQKKALSIRIIFWFVNIVFWIFSALSILMLVIGVVLLFNILDEGLNLNVGLPVALDLLKQGTLDLGHIQTKVEFTEAYGVIGFPETPGYIARIYGLFILVLVPIMYFLIFTFRKFVRNVYRGIFFELYNIRLLKRISYGFFVLWFFILVYSIFQYFFIASNLEFEDVSVTANIKFHLVILFISVFLWMLSHIFIHGAKLQEDNNLTI